MAKKKVYLSASYQTFPGLRSLTVSTLPKLFEEPISIVGYDANLKNSNVVNLKKSSFFVSLLPTLTEGKNNKVIPILQGISPMVTRGVFQELKNYVDFVKDREETLPGLIVQPVKTEGEEILIIVYDASCLTLPGSLLKNEKGGNMFFGEVFLPLFALKSTFALKGRSPSDFGSKGENQKIYEEELKKILVSMIIPPKERVGLVEFSGELSKEETWLEKEEEAYMKMLKDTPHSPGLHVGTFDYPKTPFQCFSKLSVDPASYMPFEQMKPENKRFYDIGKALQELRSWNRGEIIKEYIKQLEEGG